MYLANHEYHIGVKRNGWYGQMFSQPMYTDMVLAITKWFEKIVDWKGLQYLCVRSHIKCYIILYTISIRILTSSFWCVQSSPTKTWHGITLMPRSSNCTRMKAGSVHVSRIIIAPESMFHPSCTVHSLYINRVVATKWNSYWKKSLQFIKISFCCLVWKQKIHVVRNFVSYSWDKEHVIFQHYINLNIVLPLQSLSPYSIMSGVGWYYWLLQLVGCTNWIQFSYHRYTVCHSSLFDPWTPQLWLKAKIENA